MKKLIKKLLGITELEQKIILLEKEIEETYKELKDDNIKIATYIKMEEFKDKRDNKKS